MVVARTLLLDCGNSSIKYQLGAEGGRLQSAASVCELVKARSVAQVVVASVSVQGQQIKQLLLEMGIGCAVLEVRQGWHGVSLCYENPERLGIDRWLTMVALSGNDRDSLVIDAGTALTIDLLDRDDQHLGGYILPGLGLMRRSLVDDTFALPAVADAGSVDLGRSTDACIANGTLFALAATVDATVQRINRPQLEVVWTGGDAQRIRAFSQYSGECRPDLVLDGIKRLLADTSYMETLL